MLADVVAACAAVGPVFIVGPPDLVIEPATVVPDPGGGQGNAVRVGLDVASLAAASSGRAGPLVVVNADLPCVIARDLLALAGAVPQGGLAYAPAPDGTTNALGLSSPDVFAPVYGPGSAARFAGLGPSHRVDAPNLMDDIDTIDDLERLSARLGPHTRSVFATLHTDAAA